ncbi:helix-turn-helix domain-containing protein [Acuticoccus mangrovi]|uniref:Helix-turn-helix transcriptional regulator n=1 Tax=Acuticoccus mangrovi TaxID=2796142 RepID=A0A934MHC4_9HYPH|nr:helix-turn-helix transcriptional regulator [Acuticoccus mangrovi]MBJ3776800.1 helix-turn-helix transcriptional regulator [Acuticoccus mangrovi]
MFYLEPQNVGHSIFGHRHLIEAYSSPSHSHPFGQLFYASKGHVSIRTDDGYRVSSTNRAIYIPGDVEHQIIFSRPMELHAIWFDEHTVAEPLPETPGTITVPPLLRELIISATHLDIDFEPTARTSRLFSVLLDNLAPEATSSLNLQMGSDPRLRKVTLSLAQEPAEDRSLQDWARCAGASTRTLARLFVSETGLTFSNWRQQARILRSIELLADGSSVVNAAYDVGYESPNAFIVAFKRTVGTTPARYFRD